MKRSDVYCEEDYFLRAPSFDTLVYRAVREIPRGRWVTHSTEILTVPELPATG